MSPELAQNIAVEAIGAMFVTAVIGYVVARNDRLAGKEARSMLAWHVEDAIDQYFKAESQERRDVWMHEIDLILMTNVFALKAPQHHAFNHLRTSLKIIHVDGLYEHWKPEIFLQRFTEFMRSLGIPKKRTNEAVSKLEQSIKRHLARRDQ